MFRMLGNRTPLEAGWGVKMNTLEFIAWSWVLLALVLTVGSFLSFVIDAIWNLYNELDD